MYKGELSSWVSAQAEDKIFDVYLVSEVSAFAKGFMQPSITCAMIQEVVTLPNKDVLLGFKCMIQKGAMPKETIYYYKLSEIRLIDQTKYYVKLAEDTKAKMIEASKMMEEERKAKENKQDGSGE